MYGGFNSRASSGVLVRSPAHPGGPERGAGRHDLPTSTALGPDGKLYVGFLKNGNINQIANPGVVNPTPQNQTVESVGTSPNGRPILSMMGV